ncbi:glutamate decarboxylase [Serendipita vermifera]|nr:glutamate decarboxylase [Serendipita vermifera]
MALSRHIDPDELLHICKEHPHYGVLNSNHNPTVHKPVYGLNDIPKFTIPDTGIGKAAAYQLLHDEMELDGAPILNLASFVNTGMDDHADKLMSENMNKNLVDFDEYPATQAIHTRCISILADLWSVPKGCKAIGTATTGSSEAIMLGGLTMKKRWQEKMKAAGKDIHNPGPNIVFGANAQVALEKFARYFDVECRLVPVTEESNFVMDPKAAMEYIDENTIGVIVILGSTYTGAFEDVQGMSDLLDEYQSRTGIDIPIHVDAASGGFVAPFAYPDYKWGFNVSRVNTINTSGHKFGLTYPGLGWLVIKDESLLPKDLIFELHYLGTAQSSFTLNFSRSAAPVLGQMYRFLNLGRQGYTETVNADLANARLLSNALEKSYFTCLSKIHHPASTSVTSAVTSAVTGTESDPNRFVKGLPVVAFRFSDKFKAEHPHVQQRWLQQLLRIKGWIVPNYNAPKAVEQVEMLRVVVRSTMSSDLVARLVADILEVTESVMELGSDEHIMMAISEGKNRALAPVSPNHPAQPKGGHPHPAKHHGAHGKHPQKHNGRRDGSRVEHHVGVHKKEEGGEGQVGFGRPC